MVNEVTSKPERLFTELKEMTIGIGNSFSVALIVPNSRLLDLSTEPQSRSTRIRSVMLVWGPEKLV